MSKRDINPYEAPEIKEKTIRQIFKSECKHQKEFKLGDYKAPFNWGKCKECICAYIPFIVSDHFLRDVCFAMWHDEMIRYNKEAYFEINKGIIKEK